MASFIYQTFKKASHAADTLTAPPRIDYRKTIVKHRVPNFDKLFAFMGNGVRNGLKKLCDNPLLTFMGSGVKTISSEVESMGNGVFSELESMRNVAMYLYEIGDLMLQQKLDEGYVAGFSLRHNLVEVEGTVLKDAQHTITARGGNGVRGITLLLETTNGRLTDYSANVQRAAVNAEDGCWPYATLTKKFTECGILLQKQGIQVDGSVKKLTGDPKLSLKGGMSFLGAYPPSSITLTEEKGYFTLDCSAQVTPNFLIGVGRKKGVEEDEFDYNITFPVDALYTYLVMTTDLMSKNFKVQVGGDTTKEWNIDILYNRYSLSARGKKGVLNDFGFNVEFKP